MKTLMIALVCALTVGFYLLASAPLIQWAVKTQPVSPAFEATMVLITVVALGCLFLLRGNRSEAERHLMALLVKAADNAKETEERHRSRVRQLQAQNEADAEARERETHQVMQRCERQLASERQAHASAVLELKNSHAAAMSQALQQQLDRYSAERQAANERHRSELEELRREAQTKAHLCKEVSDEANALQGQLAQVEQNFCWLQKELHTAQRKLAERESWRVVIDLESLGLCGPENEATLDLGEALVRIKGNGGMTPVTQVPTVLGKKDVQRQYGLSRLSEMATA